jgi:hypothetical protein
VSELRKNAIHINKHENLEVKLKKYGAKHVFAFNYEDYGGSCNWQGNNDILISWYLSDVRKRTFKVALLLLNNTLNIRKLQSIPVSDIARNKNNEVPNALEMLIKYYGLTVDKDMAFMSSVRLISEQINEEELSYFIKGVGELSETLITLPEINLNLPLDLDSLYE